MKEKYERPRKRVILALAALAAIAGLSACRAYVDPALIEQREAAAFAYAPNAGASWAGQTSEPPANHADEIGAPNSERSPMGNLEADRPETLQRTEPEIAAAAAPGFVYQADLDSMIAAGLARNAGLHAAFDRWRAALDRIPQVTSLPDPNLSWGHFIQEIQTRTGPQQNRYSIKQTFPWLSKLRRRGDLAAAQAETLWWVVEEKRLEIIRDITDAWAEVAYLGRAIGITQDTLELLMQLEPIVQRRIQGGASLADLLRLQVEIGKVDNELETLQSRAPTLWARLAAAMNSDTSEPLAQPILEEPNIASYDSAQLSGLIMQRNPGLLGRRSAAEAAARRIALARLDRKPDLTLGFDYFDIESAKIPNQRDSGQDAYAVTFSMNLPIWRNKYSAAEREATRRRDAAFAELDQRERNLISLLATRVFQLDDAARQVALQRDTLVPRAREAFAITAAAYEAGEATIADLIDTEREVLVLKKYYWRASADYLQREVELKVLCGGELQ